MQLIAPFVGVVGGLPPDILDELADEQGHQDGFIHRILFSFPEHVPQVWTEEEVSPAHQSALDMVLQRLWELEPNPQLCPAHGVISSLPFPVDSTQLRARHDRRRVRLRAA